MAVVRDIFIALFVAKSFNRRGGVGDAPDASLSQNGGGGGMGDSILGDSVDEPDAAILVVGYSVPPQVFKWKSCGGGRAYEW